MFCPTLELVAELLSLIDDRQAFCAAVTAEIRARSGARAAFLLAGSPGAAEVLAGSPAGLAVPATVLPQAVAATAPVVLDDADGAVVVIPLLAGEERVGTLLVLDAPAAAVTALLAPSALGDALAQALRLSRLRQDEAEELAMSRRIQEQLREAQRAETVARLAAGVAHDISNVLHVAFGYSELLLDEPDMPIAERRVFAEEILRAAERGSSLAQQLLAVGKQDEGEVKTVAVDGLVHGLARLLRHLLGEDIELRLDLSAAEELLPVTADPTQLQQVLMNLCTNCRDALPAGGCVTIRVRNYHLSAEEGTGVLPAAPGDYVRIDVEDNGTGIAPEVKGLVFEPFFTTRPPGQGAGLGLAAVYGIVRQYHGFIRLRSAVGMGTGVTVFLPARPTVRHELARTAQRPLGSTRCARVFLAEDSRQLRNLLVHQLEAAQYQLETARDGSEACEKLDHLKQAPDLFLLDVVMPGKGGREVYEHARSLGMHRPVLFCTGYGDCQIPPEYLASLGNASLLKKPCSAAVLISAIEDLLSQAEG